MTLGAGAVPVDADYEAIAQRNRGALPVAGCATECAWLGWYWHVEISLARNRDTLRQGGATDCVAIGAWLKLSAACRVSFDIVWPSVKGGSMSYQELKQRHRQERDAQHSNLRLRVHRALSWLDRAEQVKLRGGQPRPLFRWSTVVPDSVASVVLPMRCRRWLHRG